jgi:hypothetical protein
MESKAGPAVSVKVTDESKGEVEVVFSTLNVVDKDGDVTRPGAFGSQEVRISAYNHQSWGGVLPVGKGKIFERTQKDNVLEGIMQGQFFMDTTGGRETFLTVKGLGGLMEWSYGYDIIEEAKGMFPDDSGDQVRFLDRLKVHEVSPVILGAGENTRTNFAKGIGSPIPSLAQFHRARKEALKQDLTEDQVNAAKGVLNQISVLLNQADPPGQEEVDDLIDALEQAIGVSEPEMESIDFDGGVKLIDHLTWGSAELEIICNRVAKAVAQRAENGQELSEPTLDVVKAILSKSDRLREAIAIQPRKEQTPEQREMLEQIFKNSQALLFLTPGGEV